MWKMLKRQPPCLNRAGTDRLSRTGRNRGAKSSAASCPLRDLWSASRAHQACGSRSSQIIPPISPLVHPRVPREPARSAKLWVDLFRKCSHNRHIELRIILLHVAHAVLLAEFLDYGLHGVG